MKQPVVIIGLGEMGGVFARGFLRTGHPVYPITRAMDMAAEAAALDDPHLVLVAVGEADLHPVLEQMPAPWRGRLGLLQNELLPRDWQAHDLSRPTVISVWFEKKKGRDAKVLLPSPAFGSAAGLLVDALAAVEVPARSLADEAELRHELVRKNVYILTTNIAGLAVGGDVEGLWRDHQTLAGEVANDVMDIQAWLTGSELDRPRLMDGLVEGIEGDPRHQCMGRSAPARLARALRFADEAGLAVPRLRAIQAGL